MKDYKHVGINVTTENNGVKLEMSNSFKVLEAVLGETVTSSFTLTLKGEEVRLDFEEDKVDLSRLEVLDDKLRNSIEIKFRGKIRPIVSLYFQEN